MPNGNVATKLELRPRQPITDAVIEGMTDQDAKTLLLQLKKFTAAAQKRWQQDVTNADAKFEFEKRRWIERETEEMLYPGRARAR